jgi:hypothetical protein
MAKPKIYADTVGMKDRSVDQGYIETTSGAGSLTFGNATSTFGAEFRTFGGSGSAQWSFVPTTNVSNHGRVNDNLDGAPATFTAKHNGVRYSLASAKECDFAVFYCNKVDSNATFYIYTSDSSSSNYTELTSASLSAGWNVISFTATTKQYWVFQLSSSTSSMDVEISEIILGQLLEFPHMWSLDGRFDRQFKNIVVSSENGSEYAHKTGISKLKWKVGMPNIDSTFKGQLRTLYDDLIGSDKNFIFIDDNSSKYYARMVGKPNVKQIASNRYSADLEISE